MAKKENGDFNGWGSDPLPKLPSKRAPILLEITEPKEFLAMSDDDTDPRIGMFSSELRARFYANFDELKPVYDITIQSSSMHVKPADAVRALYDAQNAVNRLLTKFGYKWVAYSMNQIESARKRRAGAIEKKALAKAKRAEAKDLLAEAVSDLSY